jgi:hypothetical protein
LILHSLPQLNNLARTNARTKLGCDIRDHSKDSRVMAGREVQIHSHDFLAPVSVSHSNIVKGHTVTSTV